MPVDLPARRTPSAVPAWRGALTFLVAALGALTLILVLPVPRMQDADAPALVIGP